MEERTVSGAELARFNALAGSWWDPHGPMRPLHRMNPARIVWICNQIATAFPNPTSLRLLDVGCGAGIAAEALARRGFNVVGIDAAAETIAAARRHADESPALSLTYRVGTAEQVLTAGDRFSVVTALEVIEHVPAPAAFVQTLADLLNPGGMLVVSTLNRTARSFLAAKVGAEYLLHWLPVGTHDWRRFLTPAELAAMMRNAGLRVTGLVGISPDPLRGGWRITRDPAVNYLMSAVR